MPGEKSNALSVSESFPQRMRESLPIAPREPFQMYLSDAKQYQLLSRDEERELVMQYKETGDPEAANKLITSNLRLVVKIALDFHQSWSKNFMDLVQEGNLGLLQAVNRFDPDRGTKFSYYAAFWIKAYIMKYLLDNWRLVKIGTTQNQRKLFYGLQKEKQELLRKGVRPEPLLLAEQLGVKEAEVIEMSQRLQNPEISTDAASNDQTDHPFVLHLSDPGRSVDEQLSHKQLKRTLSEKVEVFRQTLSGREADIFDSRIMTEEPVTLQKIGERYNISRERVRQIQAGMIRNITTWLNNEIPDFQLEYADMAG
jgi:RNA polymerase sigma-32 factor